MKNRVIFLLFFLSFFAKGYSQKVFELPTYSKIAQENIFVHYNSSFLLSGEKLLYSVYCLNKETGKPSSLSKIAYVEIIAEDLKKQIKYKIKLNKGIGQGDFSIPVSLKTGSYKIIAYTNWMINKKKVSFFEGDIFILNPFINNSRFLETEKSDIKTDLDQKVSHKNKTEFLSLNLDKNTFSSRKKINLKIESIKNELSYGNYSISIRKKNIIDMLEKPTTVKFQEDLPGVLQISNKDSLEFLPEFRGSIIKGKILNKKTLKPVSNIPISFSIPSKDYIFKISNSNSIGNFYFILNENYNEDKANIKIIDKNKEEYKIVISEDLPLNYKDLKFKDFKFSKTLIKSLTKKSNNIQIENAYNSLKKDSVLPFKPPGKFFSINNKNTYTYVLDDFTRFKTLKETLTEITQESYYKKKGDQYYIRIHNKDFVYNDNEPLILVDGIQVLDANKIIDFDTNKVEKIIIVRENYIYGAKVFNGLFIIETINGDYRDLIETDYSKNIPLLKPLIKKKYFTPNYEKNNLSRIPDFRTQLYWNPSFSINSLKTNLSFFTSDDKGVYEIELEGFTNSGKPVSLRKSFTVK